LLGLEGTLTLAIAVRGAVTTIEGLAEPGGTLHRRSRPSSIRTRSGAATERRGRDFAVALNTDLVDLRRRNDTMHEPIKDQGAALYQSPADPVL